VKTHRKVALILGLIAGGGLLLITFIQFPTINLARVLGQFAGAFVIGVIVFLISYGIGALVVRIKR